ncbi:MAG: hypothetical protein PVG14_03635 [Anaerolineales bacterium]|jgi:hypothetical protein
MKHKHNWEEVKKRFSAWWHGEGMVLLITAPASKHLFDAEKPKPPDDPRERWLDAQYRIAYSEYVISRIYYGGDAFPDMNHYMGPGCLALYLGCEGVFPAEEGGFGEQNATVWFKPFIFEPDKAPTLYYDAENYYWKRHMQMIRLAVRRAKGCYEVGMPELVDNIDILASMRGTQNLLVDLLERPAYVHDYQSQILDLYTRYYDELYEVIKGDDGGCSFYGYHVWAPGRIAKFQCDLACMISQKAFREFVQPYLVEYCNKVEYSVFHLDGRGAIRHIDVILEVASLNAVQWVPGAGENSLGHDCGSPKWFPLYEKIRAAGKSLHLHMASNNMSYFLDQFGPKGIYISTSAPSEEEANRLLNEFYQ